MSAPGLAWFLALSTAAHAALLFAYRPATPLIGQAGQPLRLSIEQAGSHHPARPAPAPAREPAPQPVAGKTATAGPEPAPAARTGNTARNAVTAAPPAPAATDTAAAPGMEAEAAATPSAASTQPAIARPEDHLRRSVLELFSRRLDYPAIARRKGWQGIVTLRLLIEPDGRISRLDVDRTSGYPVLDRAAVESLQLASVPQAGRWLHGRALELLVPVEYRLIGG
jgi:protein TonB